MFLDIMTRLQPKNQDDWKAIYWLNCWGVKPSEISKVEIHIDKVAGQAYMWGVKQ